MRNESDLEELRVVVQSLLMHHEGPRTSASISTHIERFRSLYKIDDEAALELTRYFESIYQVTMDIGSVITDNEFEPWLHHAKTEIDPFFWNRYKALLVSKGMSGNVVTTLDNVTDRILGLLEDPTKNGKWDRRGMVIGHVQSGKTSNYTGLICKAADAGYKLIIVIAGIHNNLRSQTQLRIDEGFVGRDSSALGLRRQEKIVGVGNYDLSRRPVTFTSATKDFNVATANSVGVQITGLSEPAVLVIKKNPKTLQTLTNWLENHNSLQGSEKIPVPLLVIDDEADNASINLNYGKDGVSKINGLIRGLLNRFDRCSYVGYTATPFANIFIDPESEEEMYGQDLFPRNFIVGLETPSNYFGPSKIFLEDSSKHIVLIEDNQKLLPLKHKISHELSELPGSLLEAIRAFILVRAIRIARKQVGEHNSMLVNASRFTRVQEQIRNRVHEYLVEIQAAIRIYGSLPYDERQAPQVLRDLHDTWKKYFSSDFPSWISVYEHLHGSASEISAITVNSSSSSALDYDGYRAAGRNVIAVGGFSLSRGLTLEGLSISYFLRNTAMYDTLMQMGRWFGYRQGYEDLCRIWMTEDSVGWFEHVTEAIEELRSEVREMERVRAEPRDFGLKVRSHPSSLMITAKNRIGKGMQVPVRIGLAKRLIETAVVDRQSISFNQKLGRQLIEDLFDTRQGADVEDVSGGYLIRDVDVGPILDFLSRFRNSVASPLTDPEVVQNYILDKRQTELARWDVFIASIRDEQDSEFSFEILGRRVNCPRRSSPTESKGGSNLRVSAKNRVASRGVEKSGLEVSVAEGAEERFRKENPNMKVANYPDRIYREVRTRPLMIFYFLDVRNSDNPDTREVETPVLTWGMSFPRTNSKEKLVGYLVNGPWLQQFMTDVADDDDEVERVDDK